MVRKNSSVSNFNSLPHSGDGWRSCGYLSGSLVSEMLRDEKVFLERNSIYCFEIIHKPSAIDACAIRYRILLHNS